MDMMPYILQVVQDSDRYSTIQPAPLTMNFDTRGVEGKIPGPGIFQLIDFHGKYALDPGNALVMDQAGLDCVDVEQVI